MAETNTSRRVDHRARPEGGLRPRHDAEVDELALRVRRGLEPRLLHRFLKEPGPLVRRQPLRVDHDVIEEGIVDAHVVQELHARGALVVGLADVVEGRLARQPLLLLHAVGPDPLRSIGADPQRVRDGTQDDRRGESRQHDIVAAGHLENDRFNEELVPMLRVGEALPERRLLLGRVPEVSDVLAEPLGRLCDDLSIGEPIAQALRQPTADLVTQAPCCLGNRHDAHTAPPVWPGGRPRNAWPASGIE